MSMSPFIQNTIDEKKEKERDQTVKFLLEKIAKLVFHQQECDAKIAALVQRIEQLEKKNK
jgi:prefoldin subunit 5